MLDIGMRQFEFNQNTSTNTTQSVSKPCSDPQQPTSANVLLSPFLISEKSLIALSRYSSRRYLASWLHMLVMVRVFPDYVTTLNAALYLSRLRHPNLELLLGACLPNSHSNNVYNHGLIVTEYVDGPSVAQLIKPSSSSLSLHQAFSIAADISRALVYLHATVNSPHGAVGENTVLLDKIRGKAILLLATDMKCKCDTTGYDDDDLDVDVYCLTQLIIKLFCKVANVVIDNDCLIQYVKYVPKQLRLIIWNVLQQRANRNEKEKENVELKVTMTQLCTTIIHCVEEIEPV